MQKIFYSTGLKFHISPEFSVNWTCIDCNVCITVMKLLHDLNKRPFSALPNHYKEEFGEKSMWLKPALEHYNFQTSATIFLSRLDQNT